MPVIVALLLNCAIQLVKSLVIPSKELSSLQSLGVCYKPFGNSTFYQAKARQVLQDSTVYLLQYLLYFRIREETVNLRSSCTSKIMEIPSLCLRMCLNFVQNVSQLAIAESKIKIKRSFTTQCLVKSPPSSCSVNFSITAESGQ